MSMYGTCGNPILGREAQAQDRGSRPLRLVRRESGAVVPNIQQHHVRILEALAQLGHFVVAVEPLLRQIGTEQIEEL